MTSSTTTTLSINDEQPKDSSAALCIKIFHLNKSFRPEFTHQCFENEWIRGYLPLHLDQSQRYHSSHANHLLATRELQIQITLAPSCETCQVEFQIKEQTCKTEHVPKRIKLDNHTNVMSLEEMKERIQRALPPIVVNSEDNHSQLSKPIGTIVKTFTNQQQSFVLTIATGSEAIHYHSKIQHLATWFIESASPVQIASDEECWNVLYLFHVQSDNTYALAGYMTLYRFHALFKKPIPGIVLRLCQALIVPSFQRQGLGKIMFHTIYDAIHDFVELTVEDPAPSFTALRNVVDYERLKPHLDESTTAIQLTEAQLQQLATKARITQNQASIAFEMHRWNTLQHTEDEQAMKEYRLMVKKRLLKLFHEELSSCPTKEEKQDLLGTLFETVVQSYQQMLSQRRK